ncbi:MAG: MmpS family protein [Mycobacterium sp.]|nr:MmpS family protein [Mycobacterium sp.]
METGERLDAVVESDVRGVAVVGAPSDVATAGGEGLSQRPSRWPALLRPLRQRSPAPRTRGGSQKGRRNRGFGIFAVLRRLWIPLVILVVIAVGGFTVARLHSVFGAEKRPLYADTKINDTKPFNPKHLTYEVFGPPGTVANISYFDVNADPQRINGARLPWWVEFASTEATAVGSVVAQGDSDSIGCRILVDGEVKAERISNEVSAFTSCLLKDK